ncbi:MAG: hypothetical protein ACXWV1_06590 [Chitinophagaceae bacterium]
MNEESLLKLSLPDLFGLMTASINEFLMLVQQPENLQDIEKKQKEIQLIHKVIKAKQMEATTISH